MPLADLVGTTPSRTALRMFIIVIVVIVVNNVRERNKDVDDD